MNLEYDLKKRALHNWMTQLSLAVSAAHNNPAVTPHNVLNWLDKVQKELPEIKRLALFLANTESK